MVFILEAVGLQFLLLLSALWWMRIRGLCKLPDGRDWPWGKLGLALVGRACSLKLESNCLQTTGTVCPLCQLFSQRQPSPWLYRLYGTANGDLLKRTYANIPCPPGLRLPGPLSPPQDPADRASSGSPLTLTGRFGSASSGDHWGSWCTQVLFLPSKSLCFP